MSEIYDQIAKVKALSPQLLGLTDEQRCAVLMALASRLRENCPLILAANQSDLLRMDPLDPKYDRLLLTPDRVSSLAHDVEKIAALADPLARELEEKTLPNGLRLKKIPVPFGVVAVIFEARPNVTVDVFSLAFKAGNGVVLKGGSEAQDSNQVFCDLIHASLRSCGLPAELVYLLPPNRAAVGDLLSAVGLVDVCIPRGSQQLINYVREHAKIPVIETGAGIVHTYLDASAELELAGRVILNAKTRRVSVCNALDTLLVHQARLKELPELLAGLAAARVILYADQPSSASLSGHYPSELLQVATDESYGQEFLDYKLSIKTVTDLDEALRHIAKYSSGHSEALLATDSVVIERFCREVDAAVVYINASTAFTDGGEFGFGAEIGISTQKLHARGPMALVELTSYKWLAFGTGQIRS